jgi:hypothetical protein
MERSEARGQGKSAAEMKMAGAGRKAPGAGK